MSSKKDSKRKISALEHTEYQSTDILKSIPIIPVIPIITNVWVSASKTRNYILKDPLIDWLNHYGALKGLTADAKTPNYDSRLDFGLFIMKQGCDFEEYIMGLLREKFKTDLVEVKPSAYTTRMQETIDLMKKGTPIISQGMIFNNNKTFGIPDLIIRSDYINLITEIATISDKKNGCRFSPDWHYRIIDIKFSTLKLKANITTMLNQTNQKVYKSQLYIYNECLGYIQEYKPNKSYILGRGWEATTKDITYSSNNPLSKLGVVNFSQDDNDIASLTQDAISWWRLMTTKGVKWNIIPIPSVPELYPNMCNESSTGWEKVKFNLANDIKELTLIWQVGPDARNNAHANQVYKWDDVDCTTEILGITGSKMKPMVEKILSVNRGSSLIVPSKITNNLFDWRNNGLDFFIDFENVTSIYDIKDNSVNLIYMIGIGWVDNNEWKYKSITLTKLDIKEEEKIIREFLITLNNLTKKESYCPNCNTSIIQTKNHHGCPECLWQFCPTLGWWDGLAQCNCDSFEEKDESIKLYHYSMAESTMLNRAFDRFVFDGSEESKVLQKIKSRIVLCDLFKIIKEEPVIIKGAMDFSLKSIISALHKQGKINISYNACTINTGTKSLLAAIAASSQTNSPFNEHELIKSTIIYNEIDCRALSEILFLFRKEF